MRNVRQKFNKFRNFHHILKEITKKAENVFCTEEKKLVVHLMEIGYLYFQRLPKRSEGGKTW